MLDWLGSVAVRRRTDQRLELDLTRATGWTGWGLAGVGVWVFTIGAVWSYVLAVLVIAIGVLLGTLKRKLTFDRGDGLLHVEQRVFGIRRRAAIPLFHLRAVVVSARRRGLYVAYVERRVGGTIHLDEARRPAPLLELANAISEVTEIRVEFNAATRIAASD